MQKIGQIAVVLTIQNQACCARCAALGLIKAQSAADLGWSKACEHAWRLHTAHMDSKLGPARSPTMMSFARSWS